MRRSKVMGLLVCASVAIVAAPTYVMAESTTGKMEQKAKGAARDAKVVRRRPGQGWAGERRDGQGRGVPARQGGL